MNKQSNYRDQAIELLKKVLKRKNGSIVSMKDIHCGYTNQSFLVEYSNGKKFQVRLPHCGDLINRVNEYKALSMLGKQNQFVYFDTKTGAAIKKWIEGKNPKIHWWKKWKYMDELLTLIHEIHACKIPRGNKLSRLNLDAYNENLHKLKIKYQTKFLHIVDSCNSDTQVLNHTDINALNIIIANDDQKLHLIDFEWCGLASDYWDYANFIRESKVRYEYVDWGKYIDGFDMQKLKEYIYACSVYAYLWTFQMPQTKKIKKYRLRTLRQISYYARGVVNKEDDK